MWRVRATARRDPLKRVTTNQTRLQPQVVEVVHEPVEVVLRSLRLVRLALRDSEELTLGNVDTLTSGLAGDTLGFVLETAREAPGIAKSLRQISDDAGAMVAQLSAELPGIKRTLASTRQAADSLKIGIVEIVAPSEPRQQPKGRRS